jgi:ubiquinone/menaquinone biosynthesis C-methylase UbiE
LEVSMHSHTHGNLPDLFEGRGSRVYDFVARRVVRRLYRRIADDLVNTVPEGAAVLDVGTGPGVLLVELAQRRQDLQLTGVDLSAGMVSAAERNLETFGERASARVGDATELPFEDDSFDVVVTTLSSHHWDNPADAVPELARVLRRGGRFADYDFRFAPFQLITETARERALFDGESTVIPFRSGIPLFPKVERLTMTA